MQFARRCALVAAVPALAGLSIQIWRLDHRTGSLLAALSDLAQYFTILTNAVVLGTLVWIGLGRRVSPRWTGGVVLAILVAGAVYHLLLAKLTSLHGSAHVADLLLHTVSPLAMLAWWMAFAKKDSLRWGDALAWLAWPLGYCVYALIRGRFSGFYPYYFINLSRLGWIGLAHSTATLAGGFLLLGLALVAVAKVLPTPRR
jgi:hypothetical protein